MGHRPRRLVVLALLLLVGGVAGSGCISILTLGECQVNGDCTSLHGAGWVCKQDGVGAPKQCVSTSPQVVCTADSDCPSSSACVAGTCQTGTRCECTNDAECGGPNERCESCRCVEVPPIKTGCTKDADCAAIGPGFVCNPVGNCVSSSDECKSDADCQPQTEVCSLGQCVKARMPCQDESNCPVGKKCVGSVCVNPGECLTNSDCQAPTPVCNTARQACVQCITDSDCNIQQECQPDGQCIDAKPCECQRSSQCPGNQLCEKCQCVQGPGPVIVREGDVCDEQEDPNGNTKKCTNGFQCIRFSQLGGGARCARVCRPDHPEDCGHNEKLTCLTYGSGDGKGICAYVGCNNSQDCPFQGDSCQRFNGVRACLPTLAGGNVRYGGICKATGLASNCSREATQAGHADAICLRTANGGDAGVCTIQCGRGVKCVPFLNENGTQSTTTCVSLSGAEHCLLSCKDAGDACPDDMSCQTQDNTPLCLPAP